MTKGTLFKFTISFLIITGGVNAEQSLYNKAEILNLLGAQEVRTTIIETSKGFETNVLDNPLFILGDKPDELYSINQTSSSSSRRASGESTKKQVKQKFCEIGQELSDDFQFVDNMKKASFKRYLEIKVGHGEINEDQKHQINKYLNLRVEKWFQKELNTILSAGKPDKDKIMKYLKLTEIISNLETFSRRLFQNNSPFANRSEPRSKPTVAQVMNWINANAISGNVYSVSMSSSFDQRYVEELIDFVERNNYDPQQVKRTIHYHIVNYKQQILNNGINRDGVEYMPGLNLLSALRLEDDIIYVIAGDRLRNQYLAQRYQRQAEGIDVFANESYAQMYSINQELATLPSDLVGIATRYRNDFISYINRLNDVITNCDNGSHLSGHSVFARREASMKQRISDRFKELLDYFTQENTTLGIDEMVPSIPGKPIPYLVSTPSLDV
jgi:hypothetical protein